MPSLAWFNNNRKLPLTVMEGGTSKSKALAGVASSEGLLPGSRTAVCLVLISGKGHGVSWASLKGTDAGHEGAILVT